MSHTVDPLLITRNCLEILGQARTFINFVTSYVALLLGCASSIRLLLNSEEGVRHG
jgi:hypothetical protein